jgi:hypothetical protein
MARGQDTGHHPNRKVSKDTVYARPDGTTRPKPTGNSTPEEWADYHAAADHYAKNKGKNKQQPFDPYLNTWA